MDCKLHKLCSPSGNTIVNVLVFYSGQMPFMLDIIALLRTNNPQKIPGYDPDRIENMRKLLKTHIKGIRCIIANHLHYNDH